MELYAAADQIDLTVRDVRALARAALSVVQPEDPAPEPLPTLARGLARATEAFHLPADRRRSPRDVPVGPGRRK